MNRRLARAVVCSLSLLLLGPGAAAAQETGGGEGRVELGGNVGMWIPQDDAEDYADASVGLRLRGAYWVVPAFAVGGAVDWVFVNEDAEVADLNYYGFSITGMVTAPWQARVKPYGELSLGLYTLDSDDLDSESDVGFRLGGGARVGLSPAMSLLAGVAYSTAEFDYGIVSVDVAAFILEVGLAARL